MYWGALSTDIKKSSVNWNGLPNWMEKAVQYHNTVLETCVLYYKEKDVNGTTVELLPNAPEGDAYTYLFTNSSLSDLKQFVISLGIDIQRILHELRENGDTKLSVSKCNSLKEALKNEEGSDLQKFNTYRLFQTKKYYGGIYIRIGIGFSDSPPIPYSFNRYRGGEEGEPSKSFRSGVITMAEKAEERAEFEYKSHLDAGDVEEGPALKECYMEDGIMKFKDVFEPEQMIEQEDATCKVKPVLERRNAVTSFQKWKFRDMENNELPSELKVVVTEALEKKQEDLEQNKAKDVTGFCVFVEYHPVLSDELAIANPYTKTLINKEYNDIHNKADECILTFIRTHSTRSYNTTKKYYKGGLVKQKRDSTSMFVILQRIAATKKATIARHAATLYEDLSKLLASLPRGSSIGIAYGKMKELTMTRDGEGTFTDYFQASVNLAARMVMRNWSFSTRWGITDENDNHNRVAFTSNKEDIPSMVETVLEERKIPFTVESPPLSALNAGGSETIMCLSSKFTGWKALKVGDIVGTKDDINTGEIIEDMGDTFRVVFARGDKQILKRSQIHLVKKREEFNSEEFDNFIKEIKL